MWANVEYAAELYSCSQRVWVCFEIAFRKFQSEIDQCWTTFQHSPQARFVETWIWKRKFCEKSLVRCKVEISRRPLLLWRKPRTASFSAHSNQIHQLCHWLGFHSSKIQQWPLIFLFIHQLQGSIDRRSDKSDGANWKLDKFESQQKQTQVALASSSGLSCSWWKVWKSQGTLCEQ